MYTLTIGRLLNPEWTGFFLIRKMQLAKSLLPFFSNGADARQALRSSTVLCCTNRFVLSVLIIELQ